MTEDTAPAHTFTIPSSVPAVSLLGPADEFLRLIEDSFEAGIHVRGNTITVTGSPAEAAMVERLLDELVTIVRTGQHLTPETVESSISMLRTETEEKPAEVLSLNILSNRGRTIRPKTVNQKKYVDAIDKHTIVFGIGPAGTGKTTSPMAKAVPSASGEGSLPHHLDPPGRRGRGAPGLPARHAGRKDRPPISARCTTRCTT